MAEDIVVANYTEAQVKKSQDTLESLKDEIAGKEKEKAALSEALSKAHAEFIQKLADREKSVGQKEAEAKKELERARGLASKTEIDAHLAAELKLELTSKLKDCGEKLEKFAALAKFLGFKA